MSNEQQPRMIPVTIEFPEDWIAELDSIRAETGSGSLVKFVQEAVWHWIDVKSDAGILSAPPSWTEGES